MEFQAITTNNTTTHLIQYFAARTDHRISLTKFLQQHVDSPNDTASLASSNIELFLKNGLNINLARRMADQQGENEVISPQQCPPILCCLLPCLNNTPTMKAYNNNKPDTATVTRFYQSGPKRFLMDSISLVVGDVITVYDGDIVPADCRIVRVLDDPLEVDVSLLFGSIGKRQRPMTRICMGEDNEKQGDDGNNNSNQEDSILEANNVLLTGSRVISGAALCIVTATGEGTIWSTMIRTKVWPSKVDL
tara:strand:- start:182 stop:928 length:747 start_codon:yes stop_codon:yes gene_type:complete